MTKWIVLSTVVSGECTDFLSVIGPVAKHSPRGLTFHGIFGGDRDLIYPLSFLTIVSSIQALNLSRYISPFLSV